MMQKLGNKLQVIIEQEGQEKQKKVSFQNVIDNPAEADILSLGEIMAELSVSDSIFDSVILTSQTRITKEAE
ncbi:hypothetical protein [Enterococcus sp. AZ109]|uniref:DUF1659 domain-containing protein n=1 Tax=Enterococcus sp. AZ109 TaxID=2774634 RepID=UPI003F1F12D5